jgi:hypothetical protein
MLSSFRKQDKKDEESATSGNPYKNLEKASVLQEVNYEYFKYKSFSILNRLGHLMKLRSMHENVFKF